MSKEHFKASIDMSFPRKRESIVHSAIKEAGEFLRSLLRMDSRFRGNNTATYGNNRFLLPLALIFAMGLALWVERLIFFNPMAFNDDVRNQVYWMAQILDPALYPNDFIAAYFTQPMIVSPTLKALYTLASHWMDPVNFTRMLPFVLVLLETLFLFKFSERVFPDKSHAKNYAFWTCFTFNCAQWIFKNIVGGLSRAFFYPLTFLLLWMLSAERWMIAAAVLMLAAVTYPPAFFVGLALLIVEMLRRRKENASAQAGRLRCLGLGLAGSLALGLWRYLAFPHNDAFGPLTTAAVIEKMRYFYAGGRVVLFPYSTGPVDLLFPLNWLWDVLMRLPHLYILIPVLVFLAGWWAYRKFLQPRFGMPFIPSQLTSMLIGSAMLYAAAWIALFYLYVPERYIQYTLPLLPVFVLAGLVMHFQQHFPKIQKRIAIGYITIALLGTSFAWRRDLMAPKADELALYTWLQTLPKNVMIAATPSVASNIPLYSRRSVLMSNEAYIAFHQGYFHEMHTRLHDWLQAYYATSPQPLSELAHQYGIDYFVVQRVDFTRGRLASLDKHYYYAFESAFFAARRQPVPANYWLVRLPDRCAVFTNKQFRVFRAQDVSATHCR